MAGEGERFLKRWSRLKQEGEEADPEAPETPEAAPSRLPANAEGEEVEEASAEDLDLPDIESLDKDSDYTGFLREGVPDGLRRMALRKLWLSDPVLANLDGLNDYDENFAALFQTVGDAAQKVSDAAKKLGDGDEEEAQEEVAALEDAEAPEGDDDGAAETASAADPDDEAAPAPARKPSPG
jgi:hypothetical protein